MSVVWIPKRYAVLGARLVIDSKPGDWLVVQTYSSMEYDEVNERSRDYTRQRDFSDA